METSLIQPCHHRHTEIPLFISPVRLWPRIAEETPVNKLIFQISLPGCRVAKGGKFDSQIQPRSVNVFLSDCFGFRTGSEVRCRQRGSEVQMVLRRESFTTRQAVVNQHKNTDEPGRAEPGRAEPGLCAGPGTEQTEMKQCLGSTCSTSWTFRCLQSSGSQTDVSTKIHYCSFFLLKFILLTAGTVD